MEFGAFLKSLQEPDQKFKHAITCNDLEGVISTIDCISDVNMVVDNQLGRRALHIASFNGNIDIVKFLLEHGADPQLPDCLGILPLTMAFHSGLQKVVRLILSTTKIEMNSELWKTVELEKDNHPSMPASVQHDFVMSLTNGKKSALAFSLVSTFIKTIVPTALEPNALQNCLAVLSFYAKIDVIVRLFVWCGNRLPPSFREKLLQSDMSDETRQWLTDIYNRPWSLQDSCRAVIRRNMCFNTFYATEHLDLPDMLKNYVAFNFDDDYKFDETIPVIYPLFWRGVRFTGLHGIEFGD